jgi:hypothetical protein
MPDILLGFVCIIIGVVSVAAFLVAYEDNNRSGALAATISFAFAISLMLWLIAAANSDWKYITTDAYANIKFNNVTYTVVIYEDGNGHHVIELPYYLDNTKKYLVKIPDRNRYYKGILFTIDRPIKDWIKAEEIKAEQ